MKRKRCNTPGGADGGCRQQQGTGSDVFATCARALTHSLTHPSLTQTTLTALTHTTLTSLTSLTHTLAHSPVHAHTYTYTHTLDKNGSFE